MPSTPRTTHPNMVPLLLALACLGTARIAGAACPVTHVTPRTFYVDLNGNDANPGTGTAPFQKIQTAIDCATLPGDRTFIRGGTYAEPVTVIDKHGSLAAPIVIEGQPGFAWQVGRRVKAKPRLAHGWRSGVDQLTSRGTRPSASQTAGERQGVRYARVPNEVVGSAPR